eukprot:GHVU01158505.1.p1 GENE.GHVU01158505.1~~GHVU01158505.1.p1  ORF type:complete len:758 (+),score=155.30 GHVU01158505.1:780-3053(+)
MITPLHDSGSLRKLLLANEERLKTAFAEEECCRSGKSGDRREGQTDRSGSSGRPVGSNGDTRTGRHVAASGQQGSSCAAGVPRYIRVNTSRVSLAAARETLERDLAAAAAAAAAGVSTVRHSRVPVRASAAGTAKQSITSRATTTTTTAGVKTEPHHHNHHNNNHNNQQRQHCGAIDEGGGRDGREADERKGSPIDKAVVVLVDAVVPDVLVVPSCLSSSLVKHPLVTQGLLVLQDRSSCLSPLSADLRPGMTVLDACAAPGTKTLHAIELMRRRGVIVACERDCGRAAAFVGRLKASLPLSGPHHSFAGSIGGADKSESDVTVAAVLRRLAVGGGQGDPSGPPEEGSSSAAAHAYKARPCDFGAAIDDSSTEPRLDTGERRRTDRGAAGHAGKGKSRGCASGRESSSQAITRHPYGGPSSSSSSSFPSTTAAPVYLFHPSMEAADLVVVVCRCDVATMSDFGGIDFDVVLLDPSCSGSGLPQHSEQFPNSKQNSSSSPAAAAAAAALNSKKTKAADDDDDDGDAGVDNAGAHHHHHAAAAAADVDAAAASRKNQEEEYAKINKSESGVESHHSSPALQRRLRKLSDFQLRLLQHVYRWFGRTATRTTLVYSTCSVFRQENEDVVRRFLLWQRGGGGGGGGGDHGRECGGGKARKASTAAAETREGGGGSPRVIGPPGGAALEPCGGKVRFSPAPAASWWPYRSGLTMTDNADPACADRLPSGELFARGNPERSACRGFFVAKFVCARGVDDADALR